MYEIEDIVRLRMSDELLIEFYKELITFVKHIEPTGHKLVSAMTIDDMTIDDIHKGIIYIIRNRPVLLDYMSSPEYKAAKCDYDRAKAAMMAKQIEYKEILTMWLKYANQMIEFEKVMAGWDKIEKV